MAVFSTERCYADYLTAAEIPAAASLFTNEGVRKYLGGPMSEEMAVKRLENWIGDCSRIYFSIRLASDDSFIGMTSITPHHDGIYTEVSYQLLPYYWGHGYAREILKATLNYCKNILRLTAVVSETQTKNERSRRLLENSGYKLKAKLMRFNEEQCLYIYDF